MMGRSRDKYCIEFPPILRVKKPEDQLRLLHVEDAALALVRNRLVPHFQPALGAGAPPGGAASPLRETTPVAVVSHDFVAEAETSV